MSMVRLKDLLEDLGRLNTGALSLQGRRDGGEKGGKGLRLPRGQSVLRSGGKRLSPLSSPTIMDTKPIFFRGKTRPSVTLYVTVDLNLRKSNTYYVYYDECSLCGCSESSPGGVVLNSVQCAFLLLFNLNMNDYSWFGSCVFYFTITSSVFL